MAGNCDSCGAARTSPQARNCTQCGAVWPVALGVGSLVAGQYRIVQIIGAGGSGQIYLAEDTRTFNRHCVLKRTLLAGDAAAQARFATEAQTLTKLRHPQVPQIYAFFSDTDSAYIVMEYIAGRDLEQGLSHRAADGSLVPGQPRAAAQVLHDGITVCSILEHLHSRRPAVIHCDIKPANLIRDRESNALFLVDFGAAAIAGAGENFGTPGYAPPEQYRGQRSAASDIYALGATLYHLLTDDDPTEHPLKFPKLDTMPDFVVATIEQMIAFEPRNRPSATAVRAVLERCLSGSMTRLALNTPNKAVPNTMAEFIAAVQADWKNAIRDLENGTTQAWLQSHGRTDLVHWLHNLSGTQPSALLVDALLHKIEPTLPQPRIVFSQQFIELDTDVRSYTTLDVRVHGGTTTIKVVSQPAWLIIGMTEKVLFPKFTATYNLALDSAHLSSNHKGTIVFETKFSNGKTQRHPIAVSLGTEINGNNLPHPIAVSLGTEINGNNLPLTPKKPLHLSILLLSWILVILIGFGLALLYPGSETITIHLAIGAMVGLVMTWLLAEDITDAVILTGGGTLGGVGGGTILVAFLFDFGGASGITFVLAFVGAIMGCMAYQLVKSS